MTRQKPGSFEGMTFSGVGCRWPSPARRADAESTVMRGGREDGSEVAALKRFSRHEPDTKKPRRLERGFC